jgi:hypothetical protein
MNDEDPDGDDESPVRNQIKLKKIPQVLNTVKVNNIKNRTPTPHIFNR